MTEDVANADAWKKLITRRTVGLQRCGLAGTWRQRLEAWGWRWRRFGAALEIEECEIRDADFKI